MERISQSPENSDESDVEKSEELENEKRQTHRRLLSQLSNADNQNR